MAAVNTPASPDIALSRALHGAWEIACGSLLRLGAGLVPAATAPREAPAAAPGGAFVEIDGQVLHVLVRRGAAAGVPL